MNLNVWLILLVVFGVNMSILAYLFNKAKKQKRSFESMVIEFFLKFMPLQDFRKQKNYKKAVAINSKTYRLSQRIMDKYKMQRLDECKDVYCINAKELSTKKVVFYLHGGGYWLQPTSLHFDFVSKLSKRSNVAIVFPVYPKAPVYDAKQTHAMVLDAYLYLIQEKGIDPKSIVFMGDSAGGGLALSLAQVLMEKHIPLLKQIILLSPWLDVSMSNPGMKELQSKDPLLNIERLTYAGQIYANDLPMDHPLVSPMYGPNPLEVPITIFSGTHDILHADVLKYHELTLKHNAEVDLHTFPKMNHCFAIYPIPERDEVLQLIQSIL